MEDRYIREYWFKEDLSDGLIQLFTDAKKAGMTVQGMVGDGESPTGNVLPDKKKSEEISFEDIWNGELGPDVWGCRKYMDFITDCYSDYWEHFVLLHLLVSRPYPRSNTTNQERGTSILTLMLRLLSRTVYLSTSPT